MDQASREGREHACVALVKVAPRYATPDVKGLTDDQLRDECERRLGPDYTRGLPRVREANLIEDRDKWRKRAEAAERESERLRAGMYIEGDLVGRESGPGIAAKKLDTAFYVDPLDLLADDA